VNQSEAILENYSGTVDCACIAMRGYHVSGGGQ